ncbi:hypothetical protein RND81_01G223800 [Saponaria officinalis]
MRTYDDGAGDVDRDFEALNLDLNSGIGGEIDGVMAEASTSSVNEERVDDEGVKNQRTASWATSPNHGIVFDETWKLVDDLEVLIKRLKSKQKKDGGGGKMPKNDVSDAYSDAGWSREIGGTSMSISTDNNNNNNMSSWLVERGNDYAAFVKGVAEIRRRADEARSREEAFDGHMAIGRVLYENNLYKESLVSFKRACELQPVDVRSHFRAGNCMYALGRYSEAKEEFELALEAAETGGNQWAYLLPQIHVNLGIALEGQGMVLSGCEHYREAAILYPTHYRALKLLGSALFGVGEYKAAVKALEEAVFLKPDYADAHCDLASALHALGDDDRAIVEFQKAIDLTPAHVDALYNLGGLYMDMGRYQRASEMYTRVLTLWPNHWRAQLNKAVSLLGAGESDEAKKAMKEALKMTNRVEVHDAIAHMKQLHKKKVKANGGGGVNGDNTFVVVADPLKFKTVGDRTASRQDLATALEIRAFQRLSRLGRCDVEIVKREISDNDVPLSFSGTGIPEKTIRKNTLEGLLRKMLSFLKPETFQESVKAINERILSALDESGLGRVDIGMFYAIIAPICAGSPDKRKRVAFDALLYRPVNEGNGQLRKSDAIKYIQLLRSIYMPSHGPSEMLEIHGANDSSTISLTEFLVMFDDVEWGFGIMSTLVKLETGDRVRHGHYVCSVCRYPITGSRFKEVKAHFRLCNQCYSEGKVPSSVKQDEFSFREYHSDTEAAKDKFMCFGSKNNQS